MKVLIVEDHALFREGLALILKQLSSDIEIEYADCESGCLDAVSRSGDSIDLVLLDYHLGDVTGQELLERIHPLIPEVPIVILSAEQEKEIISKVLYSGAKGFITKNSSTQVMICAIQLVLSGGVYVPPELISSNEEAVDTIKNSQQSISFESNRGVVFRLTDRQSQVLKYMQQGMSNKEIAKMLGMSPSTVKVHVAAIFRELNVKNRTQAVNLIKR